MDPPKSKRSTQSHILLKQLAPADREAFERVASVLGKPIYELWKDAPPATNVSATTPLDIPGQNERATGQDLKTTEVPTFQPQMGHVQGHPMNGDQFHGFTGSATVTTSDRILTSFDQELSYNYEPFNLQTPGFAPQDMDSQSRSNYTGNVRNKGHMGLGHTGSWTDGFELDPEPWTGLQGAALVPSTSTISQEWMGHNSSPLIFPSGSDPVIDAGASTITFSTENPEGSEQVNHTRLATANNILHGSSPSSDELLAIDDGEPQFDTWENLQLQPLDTGTQLPSSAGTSSSEWSWIEKPESEDGPERRPRIEKFKLNSLEWISSPVTSKEFPPRKQQRRGPFQDKQRQQETSETRRMNACVRCRMQKKRVRADLSLNARY